jgi:hypothetical protein
MLRATMPPGSMLSRTVTVAIGSSRWKMMRFSSKSFSIRTSDPW